MNLDVYNLILLLLRFQLLSQQVLIQLAHSQLLLDKFLSFLNIRDGIILEKNQEYLKTATEKAINIFVSLVIVRIRDHVAIAIIV